MRVLLVDLIKRAAEELQNREKARDLILSHARRARLLSKQAILITHNKQHDLAVQNLSQARKLLEENKTQIRYYHEFDHYEEVEAAYEEYVEASIFLSLQTEGRYPSDVEVGVTTSRYLLGLADVPGELRREALDALRAGDIEKAEFYLEKMDEIYVNLVSVDDISLLLKGLRRKLDITRSLIEITRGDLTSEVGRKRLSESMKQLTDKIR